MAILDYFIIIFCISVSAALITKLFGILYTSWSLQPSRFVSGSGFSEIRPLFNKRSIEDEKVEIPASLSMKEKKELQDITNNIVSFKVFCASERSLSQIFNLIPWESRGVLRFDGLDIHFTGIRYRPKFFSLNKTAVRVKYKFPRNQVKISYLPSKLFRDGGLSWLKMEVHNRKFYFTSGHHSRLAKSNQVSTQDIYEIVTDI